MGTISDKLMRIINTKEDIRQALISKGYDVPTSIPFKEYAKMISDLPCRVDSFPDIEGIVARYSALGLTNEQMAANPVWVDKTGNGHDLQMKNFAWDGMSGCDGYTESFLGDKINWKSEIHNSRKMSVFEGDRSRVSVIHNQYHFQTYVKISGINDNEGKVRGVYFYNMESEFTEGTICRTDGIYKIDITESNKRGVVGIWAYPAKKNEDVYDYPVTIEILPLYPGALVFDGVDDYGTCDNFPILTKEKGYTVVALRQWISMGEGISGLVSNVKNWFNDGAFVLEYNNSNATIKFVNRPVSFGNVNIAMDLPNNFTYQTSKSYKGVPITTGSFKGTNSLFVGKLNNIVGNCSNVAIWELVFLDHDATEEELTKIKDYFVKTYPWLFPDQAWTVVGKTNEDEDRATIANITGNGNDLVLSNFGFAEGSGYNEEGEYAGYLVTDGVDDKVVSKQFKFGENFTVILDFKFPVKKISYCGFDLSAKVRIQNLQDSGVYVVLKGNGTLIPSNVVRAVTSEGKVYDENWNEYNIVPGNISSNYTMVNLGFDGSNQFAESATKLAGIYSSTLSKDECIKAYNYLQTLKSK